MQEIKTLATCNVTSNDESDAFDKEVNALLADGWTISASSITTTTGPVYTFASMILVRETQPAPDETPHKYKVGDRVQIVTIVAVEDEQYYMDYGAVHAYIEPESDDTVVMIELDKGGLVAVYEYQLKRTTRAKATT